MIANIGFPIVLSIFLITKLEKTMLSLQSSIEELLKIIKERNKD
ncbi:MULTISPECIES: YvrJ family protein [Enterococcus]|uniref:YvrJ family protein n=1 Tax=Enterococcus gallinarum TaxID=1353 RepID=A0A3N3WBS2_ENTGA|nr:YvrJ family protein [Enterococcus gallinarum]MBF0823675.1 YvrJ family protein [Enterococcus faecalis]MBA0961124.1 YvrJ family protein [Enterococcus gallinarum]MBA0969147.1 YvrJ family protein [Enterococcus gallinarum]MBA0972458.1 YvrJ family protein [Enterococcus gallinarum]